MACSLRILDQKAECIAQLLYIHCIVQKYYLHTVHSTFGVPEATYLIRPRDKLTINLIESSNISVVLWKDLTEPSP